MPNWQARGFGMAFVIILSMETKVISLFDTYDLKAQILYAILVLLIGHSTGCLMLVV